MCLASTIFNIITVMKLFKVDSVSVHEWLRIEVLLARWMILHFLSNLQPWPRVPHRHWRSHKGLTYIPADCYWPVTAEAWCSTTWHTAVTCARSHLALHTWQRLKQLFIQTILRKRYEHWAFLTKTAVQPLLSIVKEEFSCAWFLIIQIDPMLP